MIIKPNALQKKHENKKFDLLGAWKGHLHYFEISLKKLFYLNIWAHYRSRPCLLLFSISFSKRKRLFFKCLQECDITFRKPEVFLKFPNIRNGLKFPLNSWICKTPNLCILHTKHVVISLPVAQSRNIKLDNYANYTMVLKRLYSCHEYKLDLLNSHKSIILSTSLFQNAISSGKLWLVTNSSQMIVCSIPD